MHAKLHLVKIVATVLVGALIAHNSVAAMKAAQDARAKKALAGQEKHIVALNHARVKAWHTLRDEIKANKPHHDAVKEWEAARKKAWARFKNADHVRQKVGKLLHDRNGVNRQWVHFFHEHPKLKTQSKNQKPGTAPHLPKVHEAKAERHQSRQASFAQLLGKLACPAPTPK